MENLRAYLELIIFLLKSNDCKSTSEIRKYLENSNMLEGNYHNKRRKLLNYLYNLEYLGYIERCKRKVSKRDMYWRVNKTSSFLDLVTLSDEEKNSLLLALSFIPNFYKNLKFYKNIKTILEKTNEEFSVEIEKLINNAFIYVPNFFHKSYFNKKLLHTLEMIATDILNQRFIKVIYKTEHKKVLPLRILFYEGVFYLSGLEVKDDKSFEYRLFRLNCLKRLAPLKKNSLFIYHQKKALSTFKFPDEKPFPFAVEVPNYYLKCEEDFLNIENYLIFQTQFNLEILKNGNLKIYLIGFTSKRFYSHFSQLEIKKIYEPDSNMIEILKSNLKRNLHHHLEYLDDDRLADLLSLSVRAAKYRFNIFTEKFRKFLENKIRIMEQ